jgi:3-oxoacyl-[acyl-carrier-protein] synthase II
MNLSNKKRVVITGIGLASAFGSKTDKIWKKLMNLESSIKNITNFKPYETDCKVAGEIIYGDNKDSCEINLDEYIPEKEALRIDRFIQHAYVASEEAFKDSGLLEYFKYLEANNQRDELENLLCNFGTLIGSGIGGLPRIEKTAIEMYKFNISQENLETKKNPIRDPFFIPASLINLLSGHISIKYKLKGPNISCVTACATGAHAIGESYRMIQDDVAKIMICGGSEAAICKLGIAGFSAMKALSTKYNNEPSKASRPWAKDRDGFVMGEGAGIIIIEELEHAKKRNAKIYAEIVGYGASSDAYHISAPESSGDGGKRAMKIALNNANLSIIDVDYLNAHGTSTPLGDIIELNAIKNIFADELKKDICADDMKNLYISSTKSSIGHLLGAAGSVEAIFSVLSIVKNQIPPTINLNFNNMEDFAKDFNIVHEDNFSDVSSRLEKNEKQIKIVASNSFGFGGTNASLIFKKFIK